MLKDNPRFYWSFNESSGLDDAVDHVRGQASARLVPVGDATRSAGYTPNLNNAATLDGVSDHFRANALGDHVMPGAWAIEMWVKAEGSGITPPGASGYRSNHLLNAGSAATNSNPAVVYDFGDDGVDNEVELFSSFSSGPGTPRTDGGPTINDTNWHHLVLTFYGNGAGFGVADRVDMAFDGVVTTVSRSAFSSGFNLNNALIVGASLATGANSFQGKMDELAIYDLSGLTEAQVAARTAAIAAHYGLASGGVATGLAFAQGATYTSSPAPAGGGGAYADPTNSKLTDGAIGSSQATGSAAWSSGLWAGWQWADPVITFDLGAPSTLDATFIHYLVGYSGGIHAPDAVLIQFSMDGTDFVSIPSILSMGFNDFDNGTGAGWARRSVVDLGGTAAQYVRFSFTNDAEWTFLGEIQFVLDNTTMIPEPATLGLLAAGLLALRRRRRAALARRRS